MGSKVKYENSSSKVNKNGIKSQHSESLSFFNKSDKIDTKFTSKAEQKEEGFKADLFSASISKSGSIAEGTISGSYGNLSGDLDVKAGTAAVSGGIKATLYEDGKISPSLSGSAKLEGSAIDVSTKGKYGNDDYNLNVNGNVKVGAGDLEVSGGIGKIKYKDEVTNQEVEAWGAQGKVGAEAYAVKGSIAGGFTIAGIKVNMSLEGKAGGIGAGAEGHVTAGQVGGSLSIGALLGVGVGVSIDWSNANIPFINDIVNKLTGGNNKGTEKKNQPDVSGTIASGIAVFEVKPKILKSNAEELNKVSNKLKSQHSKIESLKRQLEITGISAVRVKKIMSDINFEVNDNRVKLENLSKKLTDIAQLYTDTENSIISDTQ